MSERLNVSLSKSDKVKAFGGSNPPLCASVKTLAFADLLFANARLLLGFSLIPQQQVAAGALFYYKEKVK